MIIFVMKPVVRFGILPNGNDFAMYVSGNYIKMIATTSSYKPVPLNRDDFVGCYVNYIGDGPSKQGFIYKTSVGHFKLIDERYLVDRLKRPLSTPDILQFCEALSEPVDNIRHLLEFISL